jgi:hypothetical protein
MCLVVLSCDVLICETSRNNVNAKLIHFVEFFHFNAMASRLICRMILFLPDDDEINWKPVGVRRQVHLLQC